MNDANQKLKVYMTGHDLNSIMHACIASFISARTWGLKYSTEYVCNHNNRNGQI